MLFINITVGFTALFLLAGMAVSHFIRMRALQKHHQELQQALNQGLLQQTQSLNSLSKELQNETHALRSNLDKQQIQASQQVQDNLFKGIKELRLSTADSLDRSTEQLNQRFTELKQTTDNHLKQIGQQVETRLQQGFEKTTAVFTDIVKRLAIIDQAQQRITELSSNVVSLQEILSDKRARGAFGEVQLSSLLRNVLPESHFSLQHTLSNSKICDCLLYLPEPTGNIVIDAKFPLESYQRLMQEELAPSERQRLTSTFRKDIKHHIDTISSKYIIKNETAEGAMMFIPAEAIFAEIHAHYPDLVEHAQKQRVWLTSPTTMMAILTTVRAVIKDDATRQQVHIIQKHLHHLNRDFDLFRTRMDKLSRHIKQANDDVTDIHTSARRISDRFEKIEKVEIEESAPLELMDD